MDESNKRTPAKNTRTKMSLPISWQHVTLNVYLKTLCWRLNWFAQKRPVLRSLLKNRIWNLTVSIEGQHWLLNFNQEKVQIKLIEHMPTTNVSLWFFSTSMAKTVFDSAIHGETFWLTALRDQRMKVKGDMGLVIFLFSICRHLSWKTPQILPE
ncbi:MAG: hypothetical protein V4629_04175 [Pseudomonadota bacterium]